MRAATALTAVAVALTFLVGGLAIGDTRFAVVAALVGGFLGLWLDRVGMRPLVILAMAVAGVVGAVIGKSVVDALCLPGSCTPLSWLAAIVTALGSLVGVGLVVALATRSFEEHNAAMQQDRGATPPPEESPT